MTEYYLKPYTQLRLHQSNDIVAFANWYKVGEIFMYVPLSDPTKVPNLNTNLHTGHISHIKEIVSPHTSPYLTTIEDLIEILKQYPKTTVVMTNQNGGDWSEVHPINPSELCYCSSHKIIKTNQGWEIQYEDSDSEDSDSEDSDDHTIFFKPVLDLYS